MNTTKNENEQSIGLGDTVAKITNTLGLDKVAESVATAIGKDDCGCNCLLYTSPSPRDRQKSRMPSSA